MIGLGTLINTACIIAGGLFGMLFGSRLTKRYQDTLLGAVAVGCLFVGIGGTMQEMLRVNNGGLQTAGGLMMIVSFALGALLGEFINLEDKFEAFGEWLKHKTGSTGDQHFVEGFVVTSLTVCIGAMAVVGSIQDGMRGDYSVLALKGVMDLIIVMILSTTLGKGCAFSAIPVFVFQGTITALAQFIEPLMTPQALSNISLTGSIMIFCVGVNLIWGKKFRVANLLPTLIFAVIWAFIPGL